MNTYTYRVVLTLTGTTTTLAYDVSSTDAPDYGPIDPLVIGWTYPASAPITPAQPEAPTAEFGLVLETIADLGDVGIGSLVDLELYLGPDLVLAAELHGRITDCRAAPYFRRQVDGSLLKGVAVGFTAVDWIADLSEDDDQAEDGLAAGNLRTRIVNLAGIRAGGPSVAPDVPVVLATINVDALPASNESTLSLLTHALEEWPLVLTAGYWSALGDWIGSDNYCLAIATYDGDQIVVTPIRKNNTLNRYPARLEADGTLSWSADGPSGRVWVVDACRTDDTVDVALEGVQYTKTKHGFPNRWVAKSTTTPAARAADDAGLTPYVSVVRETEHSDLTGAQLLAQAMRPSMVDPTLWESSGFTLHMHDASALVDPGSPLMIAPATLEATLTGTLVIHGIPATQAPITHGSDVYAGRLTSARFRVAGGVVTCDVTIRPEYPRPVGGIYGVTKVLTVRGLQLDLPALTVGDLDPTITVGLARLIRATDT